MDNTATAFDWVRGGIVRGRRDERRLALMFTGGDFGEGTGVVLDSLAARGIRGAFFFTGDYLAKPEHHPHLARIVADGHYLGPHSHGHLLYCPWDDRDQTLVTCEEFEADLRRNLTDLAGYGVPGDRARYWIPPYEWYNEQIAAWSLDLGWQIVNFSPGTLSHCDYTEDDAANFRDNATIYRNILDFEARDPDGLNGFMLLTHVGAGPRRSEKFFHRLGALIDELVARGYSFARVDELLSGPA